MDTTLSCPYPLDDRVVQIQGMIGCRLIQYRPTHGVHKPIPSLITQTVAAHGGRR